MVFPYYIVDRDIQRWEKVVDPNRPTTDPAPGAKADDDAGDQSVAEDDRKAEGG